MRDINWMNCLSRNTHTILHQGRLVISDAKHSLPDFEKHVKVSLPWIHINYAAVALNVSFVCKWHSSQEGFSSFLTSSNGFINTIAVSVSKEANFLLNGLTTFDNEKKKLGECLKTQILWSQALVKNSSRINVIFGVKILKLYPSWQ